MAHPLRETIRGRAWDDDFEAESRSFPRPSVLSVSALLLVGWFPTAMFFRLAESWGRDSLKPLLINFGLIVFVTFPCIWIAGRNCERCRQVGERTIARIWSLVVLLLLAGIAFGYFGSLFLTLTPAQRGDPGALGEWLGKQS